MKQTPTGGLPASVARERSKARQGGDFIGGTVITPTRYSKVISNTKPDHSFNVVNVDWLRATTNDLSNFKATLSELTSENGLLGYADIDVKWTGKGLHGYQESAKLLIWRDNDFLTVGHIATTEDGSNKGGMIELSGVGCKVLQIENPSLWLEFYDLLQYHEWRTTRIDLALDLTGEYCKAKGYTVPKLFKAAVNDGLFKSDNLKNPNQTPTVSTAGDWSALAVGNITPESYNPLKHCKSGLTAYIGNRKSSVDFWRIYEKGKQLLGAQAEPDSVDRGWIRIEQEIKRTKAGKDIPLDTMIRPDAYFGQSRSGVRALLNELRASMNAEQAEQAARIQFEREKNLVISKKIHWAKHSYGRLFRTLTEKGASASEIIEWLSRTDGLKEFVFDIASDGKAEETKRDLLAVAA